MSAFKELKECDVVSTTYVAHPSYELVFDISTTFLTASSQVFTVLSGSQQLVYEAISGVMITSSAVVQGSARYAEVNPPGGTYGARPASASVRPVYRFREILAKNSFERDVAYTDSGLWPVNPLDFRGSIISIPQVLYGESIKRKTVKVSFVPQIPGFSAFNLIDDGYGSLVKDSIDINDFNAVSSNIDGAVFYDQGILVLKHHYNSIVNPPPPHLGTMELFVSFSGSNTVPMSIYLCSIDQGEGNFSLNSSYTSYLSSSNREEITTKNPKTFISGIGLYDENYELVGVAKVATPILNEEKSSIVFRLKLNY